MTTPVGASRAPDSAGLARLARRVVDRLGGRYSAEPALRAALDVLPSWEPVTIQLFLRATSASPAEARTWTFPLAQLAAESLTDLRDLESGLVRLTLAHHRRGMSPCPGGDRCVLLTQLPRQ